MSRDPRRWRTVALSSRIPSGKPVRVVYADSDLALFRDADGVCRALTDRCAHRRAPLSQGRLTAQFLIECPYHGWRYNGASGACVAIPNLRPDEKIPRSYRVQAFETMERNGFIQVLLGTGDGSPPPDAVDLPRLEREWEGERYLAYPESLFMQTLVDCPSSVLAMSGIRLLDDHPFGDPVVSGDRVTVEYAAVTARRSRPPKQVAEDFPYTVRISASKTLARVSVHANDTARLRATALIVPVPAGQRLTRTLWRGSGHSDSAAPLIIECRDHIDPAPVLASNNIVSLMWARAASLTTLAPDTTSAPLTVD
jgi:nitrite reductase/ring-hydroxylating ferredoxin subunit